MRGYAAIGIESPKTADNVGTLWRSAHLFGAAFLFTINTRTTKQVTDTLKAERHVPMFHYSSVDDWLAHLPLDVMVVGVEMHEKATQLPSFKHPQRAVYVLGAEDSGLSEDVVKACAHIIQIPTERSLNVATAGSIVLYDRVAKYTLQG